MTRLIKVNVFRPVGYIAASRRGTTCYVSGVCWFRTPHFQYFSVSSQLRRHSHRLFIKRPWIQSLQNDSEQIRVSSEANGLYACQSGASEEFHLSLCCQGVSAEISVSWGFSQSSLWGGWNHFTGSSLQSAWYPGWGYSFNWLGFCGWILFHGTTASFRRDQVQCIKWDQTEDVSVSRIRQFTRSQKFKVWSSTFGHDWAASNDSKWQWGTFLC